MLPAVLTAALFALSVIFGHRAAKLAGSLEANFWRVVLATVFLTIMAFTFGAGFSGGVSGWFAFSGAVGVGLGDFAIYHALPRLGPRITALFVQCLMGVFGALIEWLWLGHTLTPAQAGFSVLTLAGVVIALGTLAEIREHARTLGPGLALATFGAACTAGGAVISRNAYEVLHTHGGNLDGITAGFQRMTGGLGVSLLFYLVLRSVNRRGRRANEAGKDIVIEGETSCTPTSCQSAAGSEVPALRVVSAPRRAWPWILGNALVGQTLGVSCMQWALSTTSAARVLVIVATTPLLVIPLARIFDGTRITLRAVLGAGIAVGGVAGLILAK